MNPYNQYSSLFGTAGRAANDLGASGLGSLMGGAGNSLGVLGGLQQGGVGGYGRAAVGAGRLGANLLGNKSFNSGLGSLNNLLSIYQGIKQGGVGGYGGAAANAAQLGGHLLGNSALSSLGGYIAAPLSVYNFAKNWQSGNAGADAMGGASTGAAIGSIVPGIGTAIGAGVGALAGGLSSLIGPGKIDPETRMVNNLINAVGADPRHAQQITSSVEDPYVQMAGLFDKKSSTLPMYQKYGRMGEAKFTQDMANQINQAVAKDPSLKSASGEDIYNKVVNPWVSGMGSGWGNVGQTYADTTQGLLKGMTDQYVSGDWTKNWKPVGGQDVSSWAGNIPLFGSTQTLSQSLAPSGAPPAQAPQIRYPVTSGRTNIIPRAAGGSMKRKKSVLEQIRPDFSRAPPQHFDDGGYVDYVAGPNDSNFINQQYMAPDPSQYIPAWSDMQPPSDLGYDTSNIINSQNDPTAYGLNEFGGTGGGGAGNQVSPAISALQGLLGPNAKYAALLPLLGSLTGLTNPKQASAPGMPAGFNQSLYSPPNLARTQNKMDPNTDWYTYGQHPEAQFFSNNQLPYVPGYSPQSAAPGQATQANIQPVQGIPHAQGGALGQTFDSGSGDSYVEGPGDGTSDDIPAKLSQGEYVMDAGSVSMLGNGSNKAGAQALDRLRQNIRKHAGRKMVKGKQFMKAKKPEQYLKDGTED